MLAAQCRLPPELIYDTDECDRLASKFTFDGWDVCEFVMFLQRELGVAISDDAARNMPAPGVMRSFRLFRRKDCATIAGWIRVAVPYFQQQETLTTFPLKASKSE